MQNFSYFTNTGLVPTENNFSIIDVTTPEILVTTRVQLLFPNGLVAITKDTTNWNLPFESVIVLNGVAFQKIFDIYLPDPTQSPGSNCIFLNQSSFEINIKNFVGVTLQTLNVGEAWAFYNIDGTMQAGEWVKVQFGSTTTSAIASDLAGFGLTAFNNRLNIYNPVITRNTIIPSATLANYAFNQIVYTGGSGIQLLPVSPTINTGFSLFISNQSTSLGTLVLQPSSGTIDGLATKSIAEGTGVFVFSDGTNYFTVGSPADYSQLSSDLAGFGLTAFNNKINIYNNIIGISSPLSSIPQNYAFKQILYTGGAGTQILSNQTDGFSIFIKNSSSTSSNLVLQPESGSIDGQPSITLNINDGVYLFTDGVNWYSIGLGEGLGQRILVGNGTSAQPSISFTGSQSTGLFTNGSGDVSFSSVGTQIVDLISQGVNTTGTTADTTFYNNSVPLYYINMVYL